MSISAAARASIGDLPDSVLQQVFSLLAPRDLLRCEAVCRRWLRLGRHPVPWRHTQVSHWPGQNYSLSSRSRLSVTLLSSQNSVCAKFVESHGNIIRHLNIYEDVTCSEVRIMTSHFPELHSLRVGICGDFNRELFKYIGQQKNLRLLSVSCYTNSDPNNVPVVQLDTLPQLRTLHLDGNELQFKEFRESVMRCRLRELWIRRVYDDGEQHVEAVVASQQQSLTRFQLRFGWPELTEVCVRQLALCPHLKEFSILQYPPRLCSLFQTLFPSFEIEIKDHEYYDRYNRVSRFNSVKASRP